MQRKIDVLVIGSGPAGLTAAIYAARAGQGVLVVSGNLPGGLLTQTSFIENFPGFPEPVSGYELMERMQKQAENCGAEVIYDTVEKLVLKPEFSAVLAGGDTVLPRAVILALGAKHRELGIPGEEMFKNRGLSYCATCDGPFFRGKQVAVIGGGDVALEEAIFLSQIAETVHIVHRRDSFRASDVLVRRAAATPNIKLILDSVPVSVRGDSTVTALALKNVKLGTETVLPVDGIFVAIGLIPDTALVEGQLDLENGFIKLPEPPSSCTSIPGVFAAGDCTDPVYRQAVTAAAAGCRAGIDAANRTYKK